ncbi:MAG: rhomboid family intramembrane serine protease [Bdellovibrionia bacterium]
MIFPIPDDLKKLNETPLVLTAVALNILLFVLIFSSRPNNVHVDKLLSSEQLDISGWNYFQYLGSQSPEQLAQQPDWVQSIQIQKPSQRVLLGVYALRDAEFLNQVLQGRRFTGNSVEQERWQQTVVQYSEAQKKDPLHKYGLSSFNQSPLRWITYQFSHSDFFHLFSNLVFLMVLGFAVERRMGSAVFIGVYLIGGLAGGALFTATSPTSAVPMVGASAAVSALLAYYVMIESNRRIRFFYFLSPWPGHYGPIFLPTLLLIPLYLLTDVNSWLSTPEGFGTSVAYTAHMGGSLVGLVLGGMTRLSLFSSKLSPS